MRSRGRGREVVVSCLRKALSLLCLSIAVLAVLALAGCASTDTPPPPLPWNEPAQWERGTFGVPM